MNRIKFNHHRCCLRYFHPPFPLRHHSVSRNERTFYGDESILKYDKIGNKILWVVGELADTTHGTFQKIFFFFFRIVQHIVGMCLDRRTNRPFFYFSFRSILREMCSIYTPPEID